MGLCLISAVVMLEYLALMESTNSGRSTRVLQEIIIQNLVISMILLNKCWCLWKWDLNPSSFIVNRYLMNFIFIRRLFKFHNESESIAHMQNFLFMIGVAKSTN